jgi:hypothetical protein
MKRQYINTIVNSFIIDNNFTQESHTNLYNYIINYIEEIKLLDFGLYHILTDELDYTQQQELIYSMLIEEYMNIEEISGAEFLIGGGLIVSALSTYVLTKFLDYIQTTSFFKLYEKPINKLNNAAEKTYKFLFKDRMFFRKTKLARQILLNQSKKCFDLCGVTTGGLTPHVKSALFGQMADTEDIIQANCLLKCFIEHHIKIIIIAVQNYRQCLKLNSTKPTPPLDNITSLVANAMVAECNSFHKHIMDNYKVFEETLNVLLPGSTKAQYINLLNDELLEASKTTSLVTPQNKQLKNKYKKVKGPFNKKNFKRF